jgi:hypothetical protein
MSLPNEKKNKLADDFARDSHDFIVKRYRHLRQQDLSKDDAREIIYRGAQRTRPMINKTLEEDKS